MSGDGPSPRPRSRGDGALLAGVLAILFVVVPVIGDLIAVPAGLTAVVLGVRGILREDGADAGSSWRYVVGTAAGLLSLFAVLLMFAAIATPGVAA